MAPLRASLPTFLYTKRLTLELFDYSEAHYNCLLAAMNSLTAHFNMGDYGIRTPSQFDALNSATRLSPSTCGGRISDTDVCYLLRAGQKTGPLMGAVSLAQRGEFTPPDMGWYILEQFMGHAYAAEAGNELLGLAIQDLGVKEMTTWPGANNRQSIRVAQKIGFVEGGIIRTSDGGLSVVYILPGMVFDSSTALSLWGEDKKETWFVLVIVIDHSLTWLICRNRAHRGKLVCNLNSQQPTRYTNSFPHTEARDVFHCQHGRQQSSYPSAARADGNLQIIISDKFTRLNHTVIFPVSLERELIHAKLTQI